MKKWILLTVFIAGVGGAFWASGNFLSKQSNTYHEASSHPGACSADCCLPDDITLNATQKEHILNLEGVYCQCRDELSLQIDRKRLALADSLLQTKPDVFAIDTLLADIGKLQINLEKKTIEHILAIKNQLAPEQQERFILPIVKEIRRRCHHQALIEHNH